MLAVTPTVVEAHVPGDAAAMTAVYASDATICPGHSAAITGHDAIQRCGKYVAVLRREAGKLRIQLDIWNSGPDPES